MSHLGVDVASVKIIIHKDALADLVNDNAYIKNEVLGVAAQVRNEAAATAQSAQNGPGGSITGYAEGGFYVEWDDRGKRPRANVVSGAPGDVAMAAHFHTQKRDGVGHLRAALYKFTTRG